jgi:amino acid transporter
LFFFLGTLADFFTGIIGPGLLVSSGNALHEGGPAGALISFSLVGIIVFFVM